MRIKGLSIAYKISLLVMAISFVGISILAYLSYSMAKDIFIKHTAQIVSKNIEKYEFEVIKSINELVKSTELLSYNPSVIGFFRAYLDKHGYDEVSNKTLNQYEEELNRLFSLMLRQNEYMFQIRLIDANGQELLKIVRTKGKISKIPRNQLSSKRHRDYFYESIVLGRDEVYVSKIDLNKEFKTIEFPIKPTVRTAKSIFINDEIVGIVIINANISKMLDFGKFRENKDELMYIADEEGYYVLNTANPSKEFGFEFGFDYRMYHDFPQTKDIFEGKRDFVSFVDKSTGKIVAAKKVPISSERFVVLLQETTPKVFQKQSEGYVKTLVGYIIFLTFIVAALTIVMVRRLTNPITKLTAVATEIAKTKGRRHIPIDVKSSDEIGELAEAFNSMLESLIESRRELETFAQKLEKEVEEKTKELRKLNENLQKEVQKRIRELREKDQALSQQAKLAAMGEMIGAIAHQWRQPINYLAINLQMLSQLAEEGELTKEQVEDSVQKMLETINFMSHTIDDFRSFFRKDREAVVFDLKEAVEKTIELLKPQLESRGIRIITDMESVKVKGFKNEFRQVILNLISNARDAVSKRMSKEKIEGKIWVQVKREGDYAVVRVRDNGGGIPNEIRDRIFEPFFTTKEEGQGTGMGLYMSKQIVERMGGEISFHNTEEGAEFVIRLRAEE